ncbi:MAG: SulP family inorganic anion transporter [Anaerolineaceae bacterium]|nr:SulP family inorganic anion transporter [Anaerolineaceae bacterium]
MNVRKVFRKDLIQSYFKKKFRFDLIAGLTVAMIAVPQTMAYAAIVGVNPIYGLYAAILPAIVGAIFGSSAFLVTGPTNAIALATAGTLLLYSSRPNFLEYVFVVAIISGVIRLLLGLLRLGGIIRYVSNAVLTGFITGAGFLIILNQIPNLTGISRSVTGDAFHVLRNVFFQIPEINVYVFLIGLLSIVLLRALKSLGNRVPAELITIIICSFLVRLTGWHQNGVIIVGDLGSITKEGLHFHIPGIKVADYFDLIVGSGAVALLSLVETTSVSKMFSNQNGQRFNPAREFIGQGLASIVSGFFMGLPTGGSPSRTAVNHSSGAKTRAAAIFSGVSVLIALLVFSRWISFIPMASLAGVVMVSAAGLIDIEHIKGTWRTKMDSKVVLLTTLLSTLFLPIQFAIYLGALLSIILYLSQSSHLVLTYLSANADGSIVEHDLKDLEEIKPQIAVINVEGNLYFAAIDELEQNINKIIQSNVSVIILRLRRSRLIASTAVMALQALIAKAHAEDTMIFLCGVTEDAEDVFRSSGVFDEVGRENIFFANQFLYESTHDAINAAKQYLAYDKLISKK